jgi:hypothetical protein
VGIGDIGFWVGAQEAKAFIVSGLSNLFWCKKLFNPHFF